MADEKIPAKGLAYLGDAVFELCVRSMLLADGSRPVRDLNRAAQRFVSAGAQARMYHKIYDALSDEEQSVIKRGRNLSPASRAKNADMADYRHATGLETLFGYLYAEEQHDRIRELFALCAETSNGIKDTGD